ncbi:MAG: aromatic amino acid ammonia-lyase [Bacteroidales bacterium]|jgi:histidine ammonia-lyase|nr:aromatic amino acid ammonia-lyase [Bacteroidales bacterium]
MISVGTKKLAPDDFFQILFLGEKIELDASAVEKVKATYEFLKEFAKGKVIYGINTGLGPMAQYKINSNLELQLQYNLIRSHCSGCGDPLPEIYAKATMLSRLNTLMQAKSGVHIEVAYLLKELINRNINPYIPEHGGVGASGDLVQLAHLALNLIGEGEVWYNGKITPAQEVFEKEDLKPIGMHIREGLSLINGTSAMTGIGMINLVHAKNLFDWAVLASSMINEIVESYDDHFSEGLNKVKLHYGQRQVAFMMRSILKDSKLIRRRADHLYNGKTEQVEVFKHKVQEYYSLRCVPQVLGPVLETILNAEKVLINEVNSTSDNPIIDTEAKNVYHGGNFHGDYVALEMDKLKIAITKLSMLVERQMNYLLNDKLNEKLPPFVNLGKLGLNLGMQGVQFTAVSTVAENQSYSFPMYIHSITNNNDNQDIVSMGTNAALMTKHVIDNTYHVMSIQMITILQAIDYLNYHEKLSSYSRKKFDDLRTIVPKFSEDTTKYKAIRNIENYILENKPKFPLED